MTDATPEQCTVDTNVLVYATVDAAPLCDEARSWVTQLYAHDTELCVTSQICREYLVVFTGDPVFDRSFTVDETLGALSALRKSLRVVPPSHGLDMLAHLLRRYDVAGTQVHDANIVAAMHGTEISALATYNRSDFGRFEDITLLSPPGEDEPE